jgi:hypothetical protein
MAAILRRRRLHPSCSGTSSKSILVPLWKFGSPLAFATAAKPTPMNTDITINGRLRSLFSALLLAIIALGARPGNAHAQIYVSQLGDGPDAGFVGEFDGTTGAAINANLITGLYGPVGLALSGNTLFVANYLDGTVGAYNASTEPKSMQTLSLG